MQDVSSTSPSWRATYKWLQQYNNQRGFWERPSQIRNTSHKPLFWWSKKTAWIPETVQHIHSHRTQKWTRLIQIPSNPGTISLFTFYLIDISSLYRRACEQKTSYNQNLFCLRHRNLGVSFRIWIIHYIGIISNTLFCKWLQGIIDKTVSRHTSVRNSWFLSSFRNTLSRPFPVKLFQIISSLNFSKT